MFAATFGDNPSKAVNEEMLVRRCLCVTSVLSLHIFDIHRFPKSTLFKALSFLSESFDRTAQEHLGFSEVLNIQVADDIKALEKKKEETRKKVCEFIRSSNAEAKLVPACGFLQGNSVRSRSSLYLSYKGT